MTAPRSNRNAAEQLLGLAWPLMIQGMLVFLDSAISRYWMGRFLGGEGIAVHTTTAATVALVELVFSGIVAGCGVMVARSVGARDGRGLSVAAAAGVIAAMCWLVIAFVVLVASHPIADYLAEGIPAEPVRIYMSYWLLLTLPFTVSVSLLMTTAVNSGATRLALVQSGVHVTIALVVSPILLKTGLAYRAPALAVGLASLVNIAVIGRWLKRNARERLHGDTLDRKVVFDPKVWWGIVDVGIPAQLSRIATRIVNVSVVLFVADAGMATLAGYGIAMAFVEIAGGAAGGFARSVQVTMGQNLGAKAPLLARQTLRIALPLALLVPLVAVLVQLVATRPLVAAYASDPSVVDEGVRAVRTIAWVLFPAVLWQVMLSAFAAARATKRVLLLTLVVQGLPLLLLHSWSGDQLVGALLVIGSMYGLCFVAYLALSVPVLWRGVLAAPKPVP